MKNLILLFFTFFLFTTGFAQYANLKTLGDREFKNANYYQAAYYYKMAADKKNLHTDIPFYSAGKVTKDKIKAENIHIRYRLAESYRLYHDFENAREWYYNILSENHENVYPLARLWYGQCLRALGNFDEGLRELRRFKTAYDGNKDFIALADREIATCLFAKKQYGSPRLIKIAKMQGPWNSEAGNYAISKNGSSYWFTSSRLAENNKDHVNNIFVASEKNSFIPEVINFDKNNVHNEYGTPSITGSGNRMYLTSWYKKGSKTILAIYSSALQNTGWSQPVKLNSNVNTEGFSALQPCATSDGKRLFFVSDRPGGQGGYDIWVSDLDNAGNPINAINLGTAINTPFDEEAPFYDSINNRLVFSSKGFIGLGGFDLFESHENNGSWSVPENLGYPVNSSKDDLYYYGDPDDKNKFYVSSDRESDCCLSLFELQYLPLFISGRITDCDSNKILNNINVSLVDSASGKLLKQGVTNGGGNYNFKIVKNGPMMMMLEKPGYIKKSIPVPAHRDTLVIADACLQTIKAAKHFTVKNIFYDFNSAALRPVSKIALDSLVAVMRDNPRIKIEIRSHTDAKGNDGYNMELSDRRARSCIDYILSKGIDKNRISFEGYGKRKPIALNSFSNGEDNPAGRQLNRRSEIVIEE